MKRRNSVKYKVLSSFLFIASVLSAAQTFKTLHSFAGTAANDGSMPGYGPLVQGLDGNLYGTTVEGGINCSFVGLSGCGEVFRISTAGSIKTIYSFCSFTGCPDGNFPEGGLALNTNGVFYGMTDLGGSVGEGTVFTITSKGVLATLDSFDITSGAHPLTTLIRANNGEFYGIANSGGSAGEGLIFSLTAAGVIKVLQNFNTATTGSAGGDTGALVQGTDGNFYGTAASAGSGGEGTVFQMKPDGTIKVLHSFSGADGIEPSGLLALSTDGNFYGTTMLGGAHSQGTVFKITPTGGFTNLYNFCAVSGCPDGFDPVGGLIQGTDGNFYGTTLGGGTGGSPGTVFQITAGGVLTTLHSFSGLDGVEPFAGLVQGTDGNFYGTTNAGGTNGLGTVFSVSLGIVPFVTTLPGHAAAGVTIKILGSVVGATAVSFNGTVTVPTAVHGTYLTVVVPFGATTGFVTVTTPSGVLTSNLTFHVP
jgi:uncharacterized repeat protein (TIGR03803 family)